MEYNCVDTLEYLLKIKSQKKKKDPSKIERDQFYAAWVKLAASEGYTERAERYLYNGVSYCGAKPFKQYIDQLENKEQGIHSFFTGKMYGNNAETTFRLLVNLFALLLNDKKTAHLVSTVIMRFPRACFNKDKKRLGNIEVILLNYFFAELAPNVELIPLAEIGIKKPVFITDFISAMEISLEKIDTSKLSKNKVANIAKVQKWIEEYQQAKVSEGTSTDDEPEKAVIPSTPTVPAPVVPEAVRAETAQHSEKVKKPVVSVPISNKVPIRDSEDYPADMATFLIELLSKAGKVATVIKAESVQQKVKADVLRQALESEQEKLQRANQQIADHQVTISGLRKKLAAAEGDIIVLRQAVEQRDAIIADKDAEIAERVKMAEVLSRDRSKQADETLQRLASEIKNECSDFYGASGMEMSIELGEIMRDKLTAILAILEKSGMKIR